MDQEQWKEIFSPWVMRSAFRKVEHYYAGGEWYDPAEWLDWKHRTWENLSQLAADLITRKYKPGPFPLIPYPKKGPATRHYAVASVRDQVAFMVFMVLLGPFTEAQMTNTSMGNRLFRRRFLGSPKNASSDKRPEQRWQSAPFSLQDRPVYEPFSRGYGLYRRLAQWIATRGVYGESMHRTVREESQDEDKGRLPYNGILSGRHWEHPSDLHYARLDFGLAYPSVNREILAKQLVKLMREDGQCTRDGGGESVRSCPCLSCRVEANLERDRPLVGTHPWRILSRNESLRTQLATCLGELLCEITYIPWDEPDGWDQGDLMNPMHYLDLNKTILTPQARYALQSALSRFDSQGLWPVDCILNKEDLISHRFGLPTGLAISGWLLNIAFTDLDRAMRERYELCGTEPDVVYLRFVDDIILMSRTKSALTGAIACVRGHEFNPHPLLKLNVNKAEPASVKRHLLGNKFDYTAKDTLYRGNVGQFVTTVVREMSGKAEEAIDETGGALAVERLEELLAFAAEPNGDAEVAADAKVGFALNRIARTAWPAEGVISDGRHIVFDAYLQQILQITEESLHRHPHRFSLWRAVLVIGMRAHLYKMKSSGRGEGNTAEAGAPDWLGSSILPLIRWPVDNKDNPSPDADNQQAHAIYSVIDSLDLWSSLQTDATSLTKTIHLMEKDVRNATGTERARVRRVQHERLRKSFLRSCFWREWTWLAHLLQNALANGNTSRSPWLRHVYGDDIQLAWNWLKDLARWMDVLYPEVTGTEHFVWWWEAEAIRTAMLAISQPTEGLITRLGSPKAGLLRMAMLPKDLHDYMAYGTTTFRVLRNVLGYARREAVEAFSRKSATESKTALLWVKYCRRQDVEVCNNNTEGSPPSMLHGSKSALYPDASSGALDWAALSRASLWNEWSDLPKCFAGTLAPPHHEPLEKLSPLWRDVVYLDTYACIRRLLLAHGQNVKWEMFSSWFKSYGWTTARGYGRTSLSSAMYRIGLAEENVEYAEIAPADVPAVGVPHPMAWQFVSALATSMETRGAAWEKPLTPPTALFSEESQFLQLVKARALLFAPPYGSKPHPTDEAAQIYDDLIRSSIAMRHRGLLSYDMAPHPVFLLPAVCVFHRGEEDERDHRLILNWQLASLYFWLASGDENVLYQLYDHAPWQLSLDDRDDLRARFLVPKVQWDMLDTWLTDHDQHGQPKPTANKSWRFVDITFDDHLIWRAKELTEPKTTSGDDIALDDETNETCFGKELRVRIVQVAHGPKRKDIIKAVDEEGLHQLYAKNRSHLVEIAAHLADVRQRSRVLRDNAVSTKPWHDIVEDHLVVLPEFSFPTSHVAELRRFVRQTGVAILAGLTPRELGRAVPVTRNISRRGSRVFVNEAVLMLPSRLEKPNHRTTRVHAFRISKSYPSAMELGMTRYVANDTRNDRPHVPTAWSPGFVWFRFNYPRWGSFSVGLCSDVLDTEIWHHLRGRIQHLFLVAWNQDVELFDQITWVRGYEMYSNVILANHGSIGGSLAWSPKGSHGRELLRLRGGGQSLAASATLPVKELIQRQELQLHDAVMRHANDWCRAANDCKPECERCPLQESKTRDSSFKTPAPRFRHRD